MQQQAEGESDKKEEVSPQPHPLPPCVAVVDPDSVGEYEALEAMSRGVPVIAIWDRTLGAQPTTLGEKQGQLLLAEVLEAESLHETAVRVQAVAATAGRELKAIIVGSCSGVPLTDALSEFLNLPSNGTSLGNRRSKVLQQQLIKEAGVPHTQGASGCSWEEVEAFARSQKLPLIVKHSESSGSDGIMLCHSLQHVEEHFKRLTQAPRRTGSQAAPVLVQEFLQGKEYVVDHVSWDGVHKTVAIWVYNKGMVNNNPCMECEMSPVDSDSDVAAALVSYTRHVLDALGFRYGPSHGEIMMTPDGPRLVEMNCRCHGSCAGWLPLAKARAGYTQVSATIDAYVDLEKFRAIPELPRKSPVHGVVAVLLSYQKGKVLSAPGLARIQQMSCCINLRSYVKVGSCLERTVDLFTMAGLLTLMHSDPALVAEDLEEIRRMERSGEVFLLEEPDS